MANDVNLVSGKNLETMTSCWVDTRNADELNCTGFLSNKLDYFLFGGRNGMCVHQCVLFGQRPDFLMAGQSLQFDVMDFVVISDYKKQDLDAANTERVFITEEP